MKRINWHSIAPEIGLVLVAIPGLVLFWAVLHYNVDMMYKDEVLFVPRLQQMQEGSLKARGILQLHYDHRPAIPFLISAAFYFSSWNVGIHKYVLTILITFVVAAIVMHSVKRYMPGISWYVRMMLQVLIALLIFSLTQTEIWTQGMLVSIPLVLAFSLGAIIYVASAPLRWRSLYVAAGLCLAATLTLHQGLLSWFVVVPLLLYRFFQEQRRTSLVAWVVAALVVVTAYYTNFTPEPFKEAVSPVGLAIYDRLLFFFTFIGAPLAPSSQHVATGIGMVLVVGAPFLLQKLWRSSVIKKPIVVWGSVLALSWGMALAATIGRGWLGPEYALRPRYLMMSSVGVVAWTALLLLVMRWYQVSVRLTNIFITTLCIAAAVHSLFALPAWQNLGVTLQQQQYCFLYQDSSSDACVRSLGSGLSTSEVRSRLRSIHARRR